MRKTQISGWPLASLLLALTLLLAGSLAAIAGSHESQPQDIQSFLLGDFQVGNLNQPVGPPVPEIFMGNEAYAYLIFPEDQCDCTQEGFKLESVSQYLHFNSEQIPANLIVQGALLKADFDTANDCYVPGPVLHEGPELTITIPDNGTVLINAPTPGSPAFPLADFYFLVLRYQGLAEAQLVVDDQPQACTEYINRGNGWTDLYGRDKSGGGKIIVFGDIICAPLSVSNTFRTWDAVKSLYK